MIFLDILSCLGRKKAVFCDLPCVPLCTQSVLNLHDFSMFSVSQKICHPTSDVEQFLSPCLKSHSGDIVIARAFCVYECVRFCN